MTTLDGNPMARNGEAGKALSLSAVASFIGGTFAVVLMSFFGPALASYAIHFSPSDYVALMVFAFASLASLVGSNPVKTLLAALIGLMLASVGIDANTGVARFTFGIPDILAGIDFLVVVIGLFGMAELIHLVEQQAAGTLKTLKIDKSFVTMKDLAFTKWTILRGSVIGFFIGILPGTGASVASAVAYGAEKRAARDSSKFGNGDMRGLAAPEAANNASAGGAMVPMLTLGVPGSGTTAVLLAMLISLNITPGPLMFTQNADIVWGVIAALLIGNVLLLVLNIPLVGFFVKLLSVPPMYLLPIVTMVAFVGIYSISHSTFDLYFMVAFGVAGYFLRKLEIPLVPIILGLLLGPEMEKNLGHALVLSDGDWSVLWASPLAMGLWIVAGLGLILPYLVGPLLRRRMNAAMKENPVSD